MPTRRLALAALVGPPLGADGSAPRAQPDVPARRPKRLRDSSWGPIALAVERCRLRGRRRDPLTELAWLQDLGSRAVRHQGVEGVVEALVLRYDRRLLAVLDHPCATQEADAAARDPHRDLDVGTTALELLRVARPRGGEVEVGSPRARLGAFTGRDDARDAVHALLSATPGEQIPDADLEDQAERVEAARHDRRSFAVTHVETQPPPQSAGDYRQVRDPVLLAEPPARVDVEQLRRQAGPVLQLLRQRGEQLEPRRSELAAEAELGRRPDEQRLGLGLVEAGQLGPVAALEPVAAGRPANGHDRNARLGQRLRVALHGPLGDLEPLGQVDRRQMSACLQEQEERDE